MAVTLKRRAYDHARKLVDDDRVVLQSHGWQEHATGFESIHGCGVLAADVRAGQNDYTDIQAAAAHLHGMLEARMGPSRGRQ
jgi:hypothetical protein